MTGNGNQSAKTFMEKLVKSLQVKLILAGFSQLWYAVSSYASVVAASLLETPAAISSALYRSSSPLVCRPAETLLVCIWYAKKVQLRFEFQVGHELRTPRESFSFFKNSKLLGLDWQIGLKFIEAFGGIFGQARPILVLRVPCSCFPLFNQYFYKN